MKQYRFRLATLALLLALAPAAGCGDKSDGGDDAAPVEQLEEEPAERTETLFRFPLAEEEGQYSRGYVIGVDHNPEDLGDAFCLTYDGKGFPFCYGGHDGTDYLLYGSFEKMDEEVAYVYAAADGEVFEIEDGNYDRCHIDAENLGPGAISCDGAEIKSNYVKIRHEFGLITRYHHFKSGSLLVAPGDAVKCGDPLGLVGSSGVSSFPHLHFQVEDYDGEVIDPYSGEESQAKSYWVEQDRGIGLPGETCQEP